MAKAEDTRQGKLERRDLFWIAVPFAFIVLGFIATGLFTSSLSGAEDRTARSAAAFLLSGASLLIGGLVGFLFGIPRSLQNDNDEAEGGDRRYRANTNLEQISDWLTKILVGVGLTQIGELPGFLGAIARSWRVPLGNTALAEHFALVVVIYFVTCGFLIGYLGTRLLLLGAFTRADLSAVRREVKKEIDSQQEQDVSAFALVYAHLRPDGEGTSEVSDEDLEQSILEASPTMRAQVFSLAEKTRQNGFQRPDDRPLVERTIPIFEALVKSQGDQRTHRYLAQLGYAYKDQVHPEWDKAADWLTKAIAVRGPWRRHRYVIYEANRAACRIHMDASFAADEPAAPEDRRRIVEDLQAMMTWKVTREWLDGGPYDAWIEINSVTEDELA